jgi:hypothetical protein
MYRYVLYLHRTHRQTWRTVDRWLENNNSTTAYNNYHTHTYTHSTPPLNIQSQNYLTTDGQCASLSWCQAPIWGLRPDFCSCQTVAGLLICYCLTRIRVCRLQLLLALASAVTLVPESWGTHDHISLSQIRDTPKHGGPGPRIYIAQEQGGPVIPPCTGFPFCRLLRLAGSWWRYSNPHPRGVL